MRYLLLIFLTGCAVAPVINTTETCHGPTYNCGKGYTKDGVFYKPEPQTEHCWYPGATCYFVGISEAHDVKTTP